MCKNERRRLFLILARSLLCIWKGFSVEENVDRSHTVILRPRGIEIDKTLQLNLRYRAFMSNSGRLKIKARHLQPTRRKYLFDKRSQPLNLVVFAFRLLSMQSIRLGRLLYYITQLRYRMLLCPCQDPNDHSSRRNLTPIEQYQILVIKIAYTKSSIMVGHRSSLPQYGKVPVVSV